MTRFNFKQVTIIGCGLIGSSIALANRKYASAERISIFDTDDIVRNKARELDLGEIFDDAQSACKDADCVIICTPVGNLREAVMACSSALSEGTILTDVGSVKTFAIEQMQSVCPRGIHLVPGHPIAGTEKSGPEAGFAELFQNTWHVLTPIESKDSSYQAAVERLSAFWSSIGANVEIMNAEQHDRVLAITSHLPHIVAFNLVATAYDMTNVAESDVIKFSAGGFRDFTRIASSDPVMWRDIFLSNGEAMLSVLDKFSSDLDLLKDAIRKGDGVSMFKTFERVRGIRRSIIEAGQESTEVNFGRNLKS